MNMVEIIRHRDAQVADVLGLKPDKSDEERLYLSGSRKGIVLQNISCL